MKEIDLTLFKITGGGGFHAKPIYFFKGYFR